MTVQDHRIRDIGRRQKIRNMTQGILLVAAMLGQAVLLAWLLFGTEALPWVLAAGVLLGLLRPRVPSRWVLTMYGAQPIQYAQAPRLHSMVNVLAQRAALPTLPTIYYVPTRKANAFAAGRGKDAVLGITDGLLRRLDTRELAGVLAHEISHIRNGDTTIMSLSDLIGRFVQGLSYVGLWSVILTLPLTVSQDDPTPLLVSTVLIITPTVVTLMQLALSRSREFDADLDGAHLTGDPDGLASGLLTLERSENRIWERILIPHARTPDPVALRSHPATADRIRRLRQLTPDADQQPLVGSHEPAAPPTYPEITRPPRLRFPGIRW